MVIAIYGARNSPFSSSGEYRARILNLEFGPGLKIPQEKENWNKVNPNGDLDLDSRIHQGHVKRPKYEKVRIEFLTWYISLKVEGSRREEWEHMIYPQSFKVSLMHTNFVTRSLSSLKNLHGTKTWQKRRLSQPAVPGLPW